LTVTEHFQHSDPTSLLLQCSWLSVCVDDQLGIFDLCDSQTVYVYQQLGKVKVKFTILH